MTEYVSSARSLRLGTCTGSEGSGQADIFGQQAYFLIEVREITYMIFRWLDIIVNDLHLICSVISVVHIRNWVIILMSWAAETAGSRSSRGKQWWWWRRRWRLDDAAAAAAAHYIKMMTQFLMCMTLMTLQMRWRSLNIISSHLKTM